MKKRPQQQAQPESDVVTLTSTEIHVPSVHAVLAGDLTLPSRQKPQSVILLVHGHGSSRHNIRHQHLSKVLTDAGMSTLLLDLASQDEEKVDRSHHLDRDVGLLTRRLVDATRWVQSSANTKDLPVGYFGEGAGTAIALMAAAELGRDIGAIVSWCGQPDLAEATLVKVTSPTLLIVGELDPVTLLTNRDAYSKLICPKELKVIAGASHTFEEQGTFDGAIQSAVKWYRGQLHPLISNPHRFRARS